MAAEPPTSASAAGRDDALADAGAAAAATGDSWALRIAPLGLEARTLAEALAIFDGPTPLWVVAEVAGLPRLAAARAADALVDLGLLAAADPLEAADPDALPALGARAGSAGREEQRRRAAQLLGRTANGLEAAAAHLLAVPAGGEAWAVELLRAAAAAATAAGEHGRAAACVARALEEPLARAERTALLTELGEARTRDGADAAPAFREALLHVDPEGRPRLHLLLGRALYGAGAYRDSALELDRGLAAVPDGAVDLRGELLAAYVAAARFDRTLEDAAARHLAPLVETGTPGRTPAERALLAEVALEHGIRGRPAELTVTLALRAWADGLLLEGADQWGITVSQVAAALTWSDAFVDSVGVLTDTIADADARGQELLGATAHYLRAWPRWYLGDLAGAEVDARAALDAEGWRMYEASARAVLGHVLIDRGENTAARAALVLSEPGTWERTVPYAMLLETRSRLHVATGDLAAADVDLVEAGALLATMGNESPFCPWRSRLGVVRARLGAVEEGRALIAHELGQAERIGLPRGRAMALHARGLVDELTRADPVADFGQAAALLAGCGARVEHARALASLGRALAAAGRRADARPPLRDAVEIAADAGAGDIAARAERDLRAVGGRARRARPTTAPGGLTASELSVARLAAEGGTNRAIAEALVVTPHTVRFHLAGVYRKLGVRTRGELADALADARGGAPGAAAGDGPGGAPAP